MGERLLCTQEVIGSNPFTSTRDWLHWPYGETRRANGAKEARWIFDNRIGVISKASVTTWFGPVAFLRWMVKLGRADGGCLGAERRGRTRLAAKSFGESLNRL